MPKLDNSAKVELTANGYLIRNASKTVKVTDLGANLGVFITVEGKTYPIIERNEKAFALAVNLFNNL